MDYPKEKGIALLRSRLGLSQAGLAEKLEVTQATVSRWERGIQQPEPRQRLMLSELAYRLEGSIPLGPEVSVVTNSPYPMSIIARDWTVVAVSEPLMRMEFGDSASTCSVTGTKKNASAEMEHAVGFLRSKGFFDGEVPAARIVARSYLLAGNARPFRAVCTPVVVAGEICRLTQYLLLSEADFAELRNRQGLITIPGGTA